MLKKIFQFILILSLLFYFKNVTAQLPYMQPDSLVLKDASILVKNHISKVTITDHIQLFNDGWSGPVTPPGKSVSVHFIEVDKKGRLTSVYGMDTSHHEYTNYYYSDSGLKRIDHFDNGELADYTLYQYTGRDYTESRRFSGQDLKLSGISTLFITHSDDGRLIVYDTLKERNVDIIFPRFYNRSEYNADGYLIEKKHCYYWNPGYHCEHSTYSYYLDGHLKEQITNSISNGQVVAFTTRYIYSPDFRQLTCSGQMGDTLLPGKTVIKFDKYFKVIKYSSFDPLNWDEHPVKLILDFNCKVKYNKDSGLPRKTIRWGYHDGCERFYDKTITRFNYIK